MIKHLITSTDVVEIPEEIFQKLQKASFAEFDFIATHICSYWASGDHKDCYRKVEDGESEYTKDEVQALLDEYSKVIEFFSQCSGEAFYTLFQLLLGNLKDE